MKVPSYKGATVEVCRLAHRIWLSHYHPHGAKILTTAQQLIRDGLGAALAAFTATTTGLDDEAGERFVRALVAGLQLQLSLQHGTQEVNENMHHIESSHVPISCPMASALASSLWLQLTDDTTAMALGLASHGSNGLVTSVGTTPQALQCGNAARMGVECAMLAQQGFHSSTRALEEHEGWGHVFGSKDNKLFDPQVVVQGMETLNGFTSSFVFPKIPAQGKSSTSSSSPSIITDGMLREKFVHCASRVSPEHIVYEMDQSIQDILQAKALNRLTTLLRLLPFNEKRTILSPRRQPRRGLTKRKMFPMHTRRWPRTPNWQAFNFPSDTPDPISM
eukprot:scaffold4189_cov201-Amphora_coffeaeformis.AAC.3